jgi:hypothetical protein
MCTRILYVEFPTMEKPLNSLPPSHKIIVQNIGSFRKLCNPRWGVAARCETQLACLMTVRILLATAWYVERVIYTEWNNSSVHSVAVTLSCDTLTESTSSSSSTWTPFFFLPWERISWIFLGYHYASFVARSLGFLELTCYISAKKVLLCHFENIQSHYAEVILDKGSFLRLIPRPILMPTVSLGHIPYPFLK